MPSLYLIEGCQMLHRAYLHPGTLLALDVAVRTHSKHATVTQHVLSAGRVAMRWSSYWPMQRLQTRMLMPPCRWADGHSQIDLILCEPVKCRPGLGCCGVGSCILGCILNGPELGQLAWKIHMWFAPAEKAPR